MTESYTMRSVNGPNEGTGFTLFGRGAIVQRITYPVIKAANRNALFDYVLLLDFSQFVKPLA